MFQLQGCMKWGPPGQYTTLALKGSALGAQSWLFSSNIPFHPAVSPGTRVNSRRRAQLAAIRRHMAPFSASRFHWWDQRESSGVCAFYMPGQKFKFKLKHHAPPTESPEVALVVPSSASLSLRGRLHCQDQAFNHPSGPTC